MRSFKRIIGTVIGGALLAAGIATPAQAAWSSCNPANLCIFDGTSGTGLMYQWTVGFILNQPSDCLVLTGSQNNMASSVYYNGSFTGTNYIVLTSEPSGVLSPNRNITTAGYQDSNLAASPGITAFGNTVSRICVRS